MSFDLSVRAVASWDLLQSETVYADLCPGSSKANTGLTRRRPFDSNDVIPGPEPEREWIEQDFPNESSFSMENWTLRTGQQGELTGHIVLRSNLSFNQSMNLLFIDYLFLAFNTSTAFSPTDTPVLSPLAKVMVMIQALISFTTVALLAARANQYSLALVVIYNFCNDQRHSPNLRPASGNKPTC